MCIYNFVYTYLYMFQVLGPPLPLTHGRGTPLPCGMGSVRVLWYPT